MQGFILLYVTCENFQILIKFAYIHEKEDKRMEKKKRKKCENMIEIYFYSLGTHGYFNGIIYLVN